MTSGSFSGSSNAESPKKGPSQTVKIIIGVVIAIVVIAVIAGVASGGGGAGNIITGTSTYQIAVTGTTGVKFSGSYMGVDSGGASTSQSVDGTVPQTYTVTGSMVSVAFQNQGDTGTLTVKVLKDSTVIKESTTTASYGMVTVATD